MSVRHYPARPMETEPGETPCTTIIPPDPRGWDTIAVHEWELRRIEWSDRHPFDETNYVLEGVLHVESDGQVTVAAAGDTVTGHGGLGRALLGPGVRADALDLLAQPRGPAVGRPRLPSPLSPPAATSPRPAAAGRQIPVAAIASAGTSTVAAAIASVSAASVSR